MLALLPALAGCSSIPLPAFTSKVSYSDVTGSISRPKAPPLSPDLDAEDWRRAQGALALALDPQGNGAPVAWDNPQTKVEGIFIPAGPAFARDGKVCRAFTAKLGGTHPARELQGDACREKDGEWTLGPVKPVKRG